MSADAEWFQNSSRNQLLSTAEIAAAVNSAHPTVLLPTFQRDAVWDEAHVEKLWDSLLRGFPIGALLFARATDASAPITTRPMQFTRAEPARRTSGKPQAGTLILIDGQQRVNAIGLGLRVWSHGQRARLWIDLAHEPDPRTGLRFGLHLCTPLRPWGRQATAAQRRDAAAIFGLAGPPGTDVILGQTRPVRAQVPVPLAELIHELNAGHSVQWKRLIPASAAVNDVALEAATRGWGQLSRALSAALSLRVPGHLLTNIPDVQDLGLAFQRLNQQGVPMSPEELFFSGLKLHWPNAHDLVWDIYRDHETGRFLKPTKIVHAATRLATAAGKRDVVRLDLEEFRVLMGSASRTGTAATSFLKAMRGYLERPAESGVSRLHRLLLAARRALVYDPGLGERDPGLPLPLLARLRWRVWHGVLAWIDHHGPPGQGDRREMIRYALLDHFFVRTSSSGVARASFAHARAARSGFPDRAIYDRYRQEQSKYLEVELVSPAAHAKRLRDSDGKPVGELLVNERDLLLWCQRAVVSRWYPDFDPTRYAGAGDLPFDVDHMLPYSHLNRRGRGRSEVARGFYHHRWAVGNAPGNLRIWPRSENRGDGNRNLWDKLLLGPRTGQLPKDSALRRPPLNLKTYADVRAASYVAEEDLKLWRDVADKRWGDYDWRDPIRLRRMATAMLKRRARMYQALFDDAGFGYWLEG